MILKVDNLSKSYNSVNLLNQLTFEVNENELILLSGVNGSGKSTLLKILMGLEKKQSGKVLLAGQLIDKRKCFERINLGMSYMPQNFFLLEDYSVKDNLNFVIHALKKKYQEPTENIFNLFHQVLNLNNLYDKKISVLSRGERRKVEFWITLLKPKKLLLLDEPFSGWDVSSRSVVSQILEELKRECSIILVEHQIDKTLQSIIDFELSLGTKD